MLQIDDLALDVGRREVTVNGRPIDLTPTEFNLLHVLMEQAGYVFTRSELIRMLKDAPDNAVFRIVREVRDGDW